MTQGMLSMTNPALRFDLEIPVEERLARLESDVSHIASIVSEIKLEQRDMRRDIKELDHTVRALDVKFEKSFASLKFDLAMNKVWWLLTCAALLGVMARGFKWI